MSRGETLSRCLSSGPLPDPSIRGRVSRSAAQTPPQQDGTPAAAPSPSDPARERRRVTAGTSDTPAAVAS